MHPWQDLFDGQAVKAPQGAAVKAPLTAGDFAGIPSRRGVFLLEGAGGQPILLATAADIRARLRFRLAPPPTASRRRADLRELAASLRWKLADSHFETDWRFLQLARAIYPDRYAELVRLGGCWFVGIRRQGEFPYFACASEAGGEAGELFGPFAGRPAARRFVQILQDAFGLCRRDCFLRRATAGAPCVYGQMGRCLRVCDGSLPLEQYRAVFARACTCAAGGAQDARAEFAQEMRSLAGQMRYEQAGQVKSRLERLEELQGADFRHVGPLARFEYLLFQPGPSPTKVKVFLVHVGQVRLAGVLDYPPVAEQLAAVLAEMQALAGSPCRIGQPEREHIALVGQYLYCGPEKAGLAVRYRPALTAETLAGEIGAAAERLKVRLPSPRGKRGSRRPPGPDPQR